MSLTSKQRRDQILAGILEHGHIEVKKLAQVLGVSDATARRDLRALADEGQIELTYGGATLPRPSDFSFRSKAIRNIEAKRLIGRLAAGLVSDNEHIFLDSGTTCFEVCHNLKRRRGLQVVVNSARLALELGVYPEISVIMIGGHYRPDRMDSVGPLATATIEQLRGYVAFMGADGLSRDFGVTASDIDSAHLYRQAIRNARETILLVDHSKFLSPSLFKICEIEDISRIVTDQRPLPEWIEYLNAKGVELLYAESAPDRSTLTVDAGDSG
ncbi:MAG TPA: DeoR/GlpR family DNA-binding transcription regulator [Acidobacteriota bacterium]|nr:DeoR/GlpR family DNA-binding transcription regulator [Acidobacteriota bacterium]